MPAEGLKWKRFVQALPSYDLVVTSQDSGAALAHARGARRVLQVILAADEVVHRPPEPAPARSIPVVFAGTWMPGRGVFLVRLLESGVPVQIFGPRWRKAPEFPILAPVITDGYLDDVSYVRTIASAKIGLGLLFAGNRDLHTNRSVEIPAIGTVLCAERTADHSAMYRDGEEAILWSNAEECAALCLELLQDEVRIESIARAGRERALRNGHYNEQLLARILAEATEGGLRPQA